MTPPDQPKLRLKDRRRRLMWVKVAAGTSVVAISLIFVFFVSRLPAVMISQVNVTGTNLVDAESVKALVLQKLSGSYAYLIPHANAVFAPFASIRNAVMNSFPPVASATVSRRNFGTIDVVITERQPAALWCSGAPPESPALAPANVPAVKDASDCYLMDAGGFVYAIAMSPGVSIRYYGGITGNPVGARFLKGDFAALNSAVKGIADSIHRTPDTVTVDSGSADVSLAFLEGGVLRFTRTTDTQSILDNVASVFASQNFKDHPNFDYVDFRFGDKVYVKFK